MFAASLLAAALAFTPADATNALDAAGAFVRAHTPRDAGTLRGHLAARWLHDRVSRLGLDASLDMFTAPAPGGEGRFTNVSVEFPAPGTNGWIVVMSHYDTAPGIGKGFEGANDGASTCGLLTALAAAIRRAGPAWRRSPVALVFTDAEEKRVAYGPADGFQGSRRLAASYAADPARTVKAAICLDMLGDRDLHISIPPNGDARLKRLVLQAAANAGLEGLVTPMKPGLTVLDDHQAFVEAGFPAIDLIDFQYGSRPGLNDYWHTPADTMDKISADSLLKAGRLAAELLNLLQSEP